MKKIIYILITVMLLSIVQADNFAQGSNIDLINICTNDGAYCSSGSCNKTVIYPNGTLMVDNQEMTASGARFNYTLPNSQILGEYTEITNCCDGAECETDETTFLITYTGQDTINKTNLLLASGFMALFLILIAIFVRSEDDLVMTIFRTTSGLFGLGIVLILVPATVISERVAITLFRWGTILSYIYAIFISLFIVYKLYQLAVSAWFNTK